MPEPITANATYILNPRVEVTERVHLHGIRGGFAYIQFLTPNGYVTKVPESWVVEDEDSMTEAEWLAQASPNGSR